MTLTLLQPSSTGLCLFTSCVQRRQYSFIETPQTWPDARRYCRDQHTDLATVNDEDDLEQLTGLIESGVSLVFLGLYRSWGWSLSDADDYKEGERTFWKWTSGEPLDKAHYCGRFFNGFSCLYFSLNDSQRQCKRCI
uniref:C-type lectin domain-containing protein n=1 Tax=Cyclopterus lumpus TaxID=8103 RepID=A0A8C3AEG4_CYCLU